MTRYTLIMMRHSFLNNLVVETLLNQATGTAERKASLEMVDKIKPPSKRITLAGDKGYDVKEYTDELRKKSVVNHPAMNDTNRRSSIDGRTYRHKGMELLNWIFKFTAAAYNLMRVTKLIPA